MAHRIFAIIAVLALILGAAPTYAQSKTESMQQIRKLIHDNRSQLIVLDQRIDQHLDGNLKVNRDKINQLESEMTHLISLRQEHVLRQEFLNRLAFQISSHYQGNNLKTFLPDALKTMIQTDTKIGQSQAPLWKFMIYLRMAIKEIPEHNEQILPFLEGYIKFSSVSNPIRPDEFVVQRDYTNGRESVAASRVTRENVGDIVAQKIERRHQDLNRQQEKIDFALRRPKLKGVTQMVEAHSLVPDKMEDWQSQQELRVKLQDINNNHDFSDQFKVKLLPKDQQQAQ